MSSDWLGIGTNGNLESLSSLQNCTVKQILVSKNGNNVVGYAINDSDVAILFWCNDMLTNKNFYSTILTYENSNVTGVGGIAAKKEFVVGTDYIYYVSTNSKRIYYIYAIDGINMASHIIYRTYNSNSTKIELTMPAGATNITSNYDGTILYINLRWDGEFKSSICVFNGSDVTYDSSYKCGYVNDDGNTYTTGLVDVGNTYKTNDVIKIVTTQCSNTLDFSVVDDYDSKVEYSIFTGSFVDSFEKYSTPTFYIVKNYLKGTSNVHLFTFYSYATKLTSSIYSTVLFKNICLSNVFIDVVGGINYGYLYYNGITGAEGYSSNTVYVQNIYSGLIQITDVYDIGSTSESGSTYTPYDMNAYINYSDGLNAAAYTAICCTYSDPNFVSMSSEMYDENTFYSGGFISSSNSMYDYVQKKAVYFTNSGSATLTPTYFNRNYSYIACSDIATNSNTTLPTIVVSVFKNYENGNNENYIIYSLNGGGACFLKDTNITILENNVETERQIQNLQKGDLVKIGFNKYKKIMSIGKNSFDITKNLDLIRVLPQNSISKNVPYQDLYIVTGHSLLFEDLKYANDEYKPEIYKNNIVNEDYVYEDYDDNETKYYYKITARHCSLCEKVELENIADKIRRNNIEYFHLALENDDLDGQYCIYSNGVKSESMSINYYKTSGLKDINIPMTVNNDISIENNKNLLMC